MRRLLAPLALTLIPSLTLAKSIGIDASLLLDEDVAPPADTAPPLDYRAQVTPIVWWSSLDADVSIDGGSRFGMETIDGDEPQIAAGAEARLDTQRLTFALGGFHRSDNLDNTVATERLDTIAAGSRVDWDLDITSLSFTAGYRFDDLLPEADVDLLLDVYAGVRMFDVDLSISGPGAQLDFDETWAAPVIGGRLRLNLPHDFDVLIDADFGYLPLGDTTVGTWSVFAGFGYHPTANVGLRVGFRHLSFDYTEDVGAGDREFDAFLAGLYAGVVIRF